MSALVRSVRVEIENQAALISLHPGFLEYFAETWSYLRSEFVERDYRRFESSNSNGISKTSKTRVRFLGNLLWQKIVVSAFPIRNFVFNLYKDERWLVRNREFRLAWFANVQERNTVIP